MEEHIKTFTVRITEGLWRRLKIQAINRGETLAATVERALAEAAPPASGELAVHRSVVADREVSS